jgi:hypothetical protein
MISVRIPEYSEAQDRVVTDKGDLLDWFVVDYQPSHALECRKFRNDLSVLLTGTAREVERRAEMERVNVISMYESRIANERRWCEIQVADARIRAVWGGLTPGVLAAASVLAAAAGFLLGRM